MRPRRLKEPLLGTVQNFRNIKLLLCKLILYVFGASVARDDVEMLGWIM